MAFLLHLLEKLIGLFYCFGLPTSQSETPYGFFSQFNLVVKFEGRHEKTLVLVCLSDFRHKFDVLWVAKGKQILELHWEGHCLVPELVQEALEEAQTLFTGL